MTKEELAAKLHGREYTEEINGAEAVQAKKDGLVVVYGASDDLIEFAGAISDEAGAGNGTRVFVNKLGLLQDHADCECEFCGYEKAKKSAKKIEVLWDQGEYSWQYETDIPHASFDIVEDDEKYCRGIVFSVEDL